MHSRDSSIQIVDMSDFDELADFADLFTVPPTAKSPYSARPDSMGFPSGIQLELDLFDDGFERVSVGSSASSISGSSRAGRTTRSGSNPGSRGMMVGQFPRFVRVFYPRSRSAKLNSYGNINLSELDLDDDLISPTLPSFELTRRVSRDQMGLDETISKASSPIVLQMRREGTSTSTTDARVAESVVTRTRVHHGGRPTSLTATVRPRRASTGGGVSDWISLYNDPQTPTAIVDLERMARGFPSIPRSVGEEEEEEEEEGDEEERGIDGSSDAVSRDQRRGMKGWIDHDRLDSIASWQRQCCECDVSIAGGLCVCPFPCSCSRSSPRITGVL
jgi:hypothetical protein